MKNNSNIEEYFFIDNIQDLFSIKQATITSWGIKFSYKNILEENSIYIFALVNDDLKKMIFNKFDLKKIKNIYQLIRIYFGNLYVNLICSQRDTKENILFKISSSPAINKLIMEKLNIIQYPLNKFMISEVEAFLKNFDKVYKLEFNNNINDNNMKPKLKPKTYIKNKSCDLTSMMINNSKPNTNNLMNNNYKTSIAKNNFNNNLNMNRNNPSFNNMNNINQAKSMNIMN